MNKEEVYCYLRNKGIKFEITEHSAVYTMAEIERIKLPYPDRNGKNLFLCDSKKTCYVLITVKGNQRVDLKKFHTRFGLKRLSFASAEDLSDCLKLIPGSVTPIGLLNDEERKVTWYLESSLCDGLIGVHPNENTALIWLKTKDLIDLIKSHGNRIEIFTLDFPKV